MGGGGGGFKLYCVLLLHRYPLFDDRIRIPVRCFFIVIGVVAVYGMVVVVVVVVLLLLLVVLLLYGMVVLVVLLDRI